MIERYLDRAEALINEGTAEALREAEGLIREVEDSGFADMYEDEIIVLRAKL